VEKAHGRGWLIINLKKIVPTGRHLVLSAMGTADAHNEVTHITLCRDLKAVTVPFEGKLTSEATSVWKKFQKM